MMQLYDTITKFYQKLKALFQNLISTVILLFEHLKLLNHASIGIPVTSLIQSRQCGLTAKQSVATAQWDSNKTTLLINGSMNQFLKRVYLEGLTVIKKIVSS